MPKPEAHPGMPIIRRTPKNRAKTRSSYSGNQLSYLANGTRPDLAWAVGRAASGMISPTKGEWERIKRLYRYLNRARSIGLHYKPNEKQLKIESYVDSSFATDRQRVEV